MDDPSSDSLFNDHPLAHSMPGAGVVHYIIFDLAGLVSRSVSGLPCRLNRSMQHRR